jgi:amino acid adenylation domain-containing protein
MDHMENHSEITGSCLLTAAQTTPARSSFAQERMWFMEQLEPGSALYNISIALRLRGKLHVEAVEKALQQIVSRHEALRTAFVSEHGAVRPVIEKAVTLALPLLDLSHVETQEREQQAEAILIEEAQRPFDLRQAPLLRTQLLRMGSEDHILQITLHHIVTDGWSMGVLLQEFTDLYQAEIEGRTDRLPRLAWQYRDYAEWQKEHVRGELLEEQMVYWRKQLAEVPAALELPTDRPRPTTRSYRGEHYEFTLDQAATKALHVFCRKQRATLFMGLLAGYTALLHRYTGQADIVIGTPVAGRNREETEPLIGLFVNTLALRTDLSGNPEFGELLRRVRETTLDAYEHQDIPFEKLVEEFAPTRNSGRSPLFQTMLVLENAPLPPVHLSGIEVRGKQLFNCTSAFDLTLIAQETSGGLACVFEYSTELFEAQTIHRMAGHLQRLLQHVTTKPESCITELSLLSEAEHHEIIELWNTTQAVYPRHSCIHELFEQQTAKSPDATAVIYANQQLNYRELNQRANQLAHYLRKQGVREESRVGICLERSLEMVIAMLATLKAGGAYVPLDPHYPPERLQFMLQDSAPQALVTQHSLVGQIPACAASLVCMDSDAPVIERESLHNLGRTTSPENMAYVIYTSGSTGRPKGVCLTHHGSCNLANAQRQIFQLQPGARVLQFSSLSFDAATWEWIMALTAGGQLVLASREDILPGKPLAQLLQSQQIEIATLPPSVLRMVQHGDFPALKTLVVAGEACTPDLAKWSSGRTMFNAYGPTETTVCATISRPLQLSATAPIGKPLPNTQVYVLDETMQPVPVGVTGELYVGGEGLARGYWNRPELTAEKFVPDPFCLNDGARLYRTGDRVRWLAQGELEFIGRGDHQVKIRGHRIELGEVESALRAHPEVKEAITLVREDVPGDKRLVAYITAQASDNQALPSQLRNYLREKLPDYMVPSVLVLLDKLPLTSNGKLDRRALPLGPISQPQQNYVAPRNDLEETISAIWREVLGLQQAGVDDNFFDLGGHSFAVTRVHEKIQEKIGREFPLVTLFEHPTISSLAKYLSGRNIENHDSGQLTLRVSRQLERKRQRREQHKDKADLAAV